MAAPAASVWHVHLPSHLYLHIYIYTYSYIYRGSTTHKPHNHKSYGQGKWHWFPLNSWPFKSSSFSILTSRERGSLESRDFSTRNLLFTAACGVGNCLASQVYFGWGDRVCQCLAIQPPLQPGAVRPEEPTALTAPCYLPITLLRSLCHTRRLELWIHAQSLNIHSESARPH